MSSRTLRQVMLKINKNASHGPALASTLQGSWTLSLISASSPSTLNQCGTSRRQTRLFHNTPARRLYIPDTIVAGCLGVAGGIMLMLYLPRYLPSMRIRRALPPLSWMMDADGKTCRDVASMVSTAFDMARKAPIRRRDQALREATFQVPHEVARVIPGAGPNSRLEDMGAVLKDSPARIPTELKYPLIMSREARAFLYFPHQSARATAAFVAVNAELIPDGRPGPPKIEVSEVSDDQNSLIRAAMAGWHACYENWREHQPYIIDRIEPGRLPIIFCFRDKAAGWFFDTKAGKFEKVTIGFAIVSLSERRK